MFMAYSTEKITAEKSSSRRTARSSTEKNSPASPIRTQIVSVRNSGIHVCGSAMQTMLQRFVQ